MNEQVEAEIISIKQVPRCALYLSIISGIHSAPELATTAQSLQASSYTVMKLAPTYQRLKVMCYQKYAISNYNVSGH